MTLIVGAICREGIVLAADSRSSVVKTWTDRETHELMTETSGFVSTDYKILLTDNNVGIATQGRVEIKGRPARLFLKDYFEAHPGLNARQVAEELNRMVADVGTIEDMELLVAGYMPGRGYKKPWIFNIDTKQRGRLKRINHPSFTWVGQTDVVDRIFGKDFVVKEGRKKEKIPSFPFMYSQYALQDAIDLAVLCIEMTYRISRFQDREQTVAPPIDVLVITQDGGRWFKKKDLIV